MKKNKNFNLQDEFFDKKLLNLIDLTERKFSNDKKIQKQIKEIKHNLKKTIRKVKLNEINNKNQK